MNCTKCKAQWTPPPNKVVTKCPFCGEQLFSPKIDGKPTEPYQVLLEIVRQFGRDTLGQPRLKGLLADLMPNVEKRHLRIFKQAVDDGIGEKLLAMQQDAAALRTMKIASLKEAFKNANGFTSTSDYVVDCFLFALGWMESPPIEDVNSAQVNTLNILQHTVEMAFADGRLSKEEAKSIFTLAKTLSISEDEANRLIIEKLKAQNYKPEKALDKTLKSKKEIILSQDWVLCNKEINEEEYESVKIGNQIWMKQNLDVSHFRNGDPIPEARTAEEWKRAGEEGKPAWCCYDNDPENENKHGKLYNWYAVNDPRGLVPKGWHVPSDDEWQVLVDYLGGGYFAGGKMKATDTSEWYNPYVGATYSSGFSGLPGGYRSDEGTFDSAGRLCGFWSSTECSETRAWYRGLIYNDARVSHRYIPKGFGVSVRCVMDSDTKDNSVIKTSTAKSIESVEIGNQIWMKRNLDISNFPYYVIKYKAAETEIDQNRTGNRCYPSFGGLEGFEVPSGSFSDSGVFRFDDTKRREFKSGQHKGRPYFVAPAIDGGKNGCFLWEELVALELWHEDLCLVGGNKGVDENGVPYFEDMFLILGRGILGQKVNGVLKLIT